ncbi:LLM class flavin-dependent oxidoreductase [Paracraurococcus lichenis]|uniref:LLM class flavin-dependent oxidoreductase n=1 Tax=Paracraurococcus lichenis TaxID=3064888 RepID=A0ABT9E5R0_9PROT|nr:LLM class flavin-dependent oxidoreductase [Paracraurococcus sp. LOR1-02]MDO9711498.1 LLM class flavin-dependent oxidoreductase [Paracraurococcus sp. LOR1-02]
MGVEFIGYVGHFNSSETMRRTGPAVDVPQIEASAKTQEHVGFDRVLVAFHSNSAESILIGQHIAHVTERLGLMIAHRPGFTAPTLAARQLATLDQISRGRAAVHIITGGNDAELAQDGDHLTKDERYARTDEYLDILRQEWRSTTPFDYAGRYYRVDRGFGDVKPYNGSSLPVYFGGASAAAIPVAGKHADVYALWGETYHQVRELVARVRAAAAPFGRQPKFSLSLRPVLADTEAKAWAKADDILERAKALRQSGGSGRSPHNARQDQGAAGPANEGSRRLLAAAAQGARLDKRLWTGIAMLTGAQGNSTGLVGTPDQVAEALLDYYDLGISTFLIRGFDPLVDAIQYGRELVPRVRHLVAERDASKVAAV